MRLIAINFCTALLFIHLHQPKWFLTP